MNDLEKEFIPYQQSLDMKELGFDEPCFGFYTYKGEIRRYTNFDGELNDFQTLKNSEITLGELSFCTVPTYSQAFRWFREKYKIRFFLQSGMSDLGEFFKVIFPDGEQRGVSYPIYEEAELECLKKLIEIIKSGSLKA
jgi:hypothetical protein